MAKGQVVKEKSQQHQELKTKTKKQEQKREDAVTQVKNNI